MSTIHILRAPTRLPPCMGGRCHLRETCAHYHDQFPRNPAERLCPAGSPSAYVPVIPRVTKVA